MFKVYDAIMGLVVGDAVGVPVEFRPRDTFNVSRSAMVVPNVGK